MNETGNDTIQALQYLYKKHLNHADWFLQVKDDEYISTNINN